MEQAVLVPVKDFAAAKGRLDPVLTPDQRVELARWLAGRVIRAATRSAEVYVACDSDEVRSWAAEHGASVVWGPGLGLNGAVDDGVARLIAAGFEHVTVSHADLALPDMITAVARPGAVTLVPDRRRDGTNVLSFPTAAPIAAEYGAGSFRRHLATALGSGRPVEVRRDPLLSLDIDTPTDLAHPMITEILPPWLPTIPANRYTHASPSPATTPA